MTNMEEIIVDLQNRIEDLEKRVESGRGGIEAAGSDVTITRESFSEEFFTTNIVNVFVDNFWTGVEGLGKFGEGLWYGAEGLSKFGIELFTASASGREKFGAGWLVDSLVGVSGIAAAKILVGISVWLNGLIFGYGGSDPKLDFTKLHIEPYKLQTTAYNYIVNGSFEHGDWGGNETQVYSASAYPHGQHAARLIASGSNIQSGYSNFVDVRGGYEKVTLSAYTHIGAIISGYFYLTVWFYKADKTACSPDHANIYTEMYYRPSWLQRSKTYTIASEFPSDCAYIRVAFLWYNASNTASGTAHVDCFQVNFGDQIPEFQDFTAYSYNWMPNKIEYEQAGDHALLTCDDWEDILSYTFNVDNDNQLILGFVSFQWFMEDSATDLLLFYWRVIIDGVVVHPTAWYQERVATSGNYLTRNNGVSTLHFLKGLDYGSHTIKLQAMYGYCPSPDNVSIGSRHLTLLVGGAAA